MTATDTRPVAPPPSTPLPVEEEERTTGYVGLVALSALLIWVGLRSGWSMVVIILSLAFMIFMHELGHYLAARRAGMKVTEFFLGFGPRLWSFQMGETEYGIKALPLGAYVKVIGMHNLEEVHPAEEHRTYRQGRYRDRLLLAVAGSAMHFLMAFVLILAVFWGGKGLETDAVAGDADWNIRAVVDDSPASEAGLLEGDSIIGAEGQAFATWTDTRLFIEAHPGDTIVFDIERAGEIVQVPVTVGVNDETGLGRMGIAKSVDPFVQVGALEAVPEAFVELGTQMKNSVVGLAQFFNPSNLGDFFSGLPDAADDDAVTDGDRVVSIVGVAQIGADLTEEGGWYGWAITLIGINVFVGVFNLAPLLPLDGGHVAIATYERLRSRRGRRHHVDVTKLLPLTWAVVILLVLVGFAAIYQDIVNPISL